MSIKEKILNFKLADLGKVNFFKIVLSINSTLKRWFIWILYLTSVVLSGSIIIHVIRKRPKYIHELIDSLYVWQQYSFKLLLSFLVISLLYKVFSPNLLHLRHLNYFKKNPPKWLAVLLGVLIIIYIDVFLNILGPKTYSPTLKDWLKFVIGPALVIGLLKIGSLNRKKSTANTVNKTKDLNSPELKINDLLDWLKPNTRLTFDILENLSVSKRLYKLLLKDTQSIGIIGDFGSGKTTITQWIIQESDETNKTPRIVFSLHSCWNFIDSTTSIHKMLTDAINNLANYIDTFTISSLPDQYCQSLSSKTKLSWLESVSNLIFDSRNPIKQFKKLNNLLSDLDIILVLVIEDLDRNESKSFNIQEVLGFLQQLREFKNIKFILTGNTKDLKPNKSNRKSHIDFEKLCDHPEYLLELAPEVTGRVITLIRDHCLDPEDIYIPKNGYLEKATWDESSYSYIMDKPELWPPTAITRLISTPRTLCLTLRQTMHYWESLEGEIDWDNLLILNTLKSVSPEIFNFIYRNWKFLNHKDLYGIKEPENLRNAIKSEWDQLLSKPKYETNAINILVELILPSTTFWLFNERSSHFEYKPQGIHLRRYWNRYLQPSIVVSEIKDQEIFKDLKEWESTRDLESKLLSNLAENEKYNSIFKNLASAYFKNNTQLLLDLATDIFTIFYNHQKLEETNTNFISVTTITDLINNPNSFNFNHDELLNWFNNLLSLSIDINLKYTLSLLLNFRIPFHDLQSCSKPHLISELKLKITDHNILKSIFPDQQETLLLYLLYSDYLSSYCIKTDDDDNGSIFYSTDELINWIWLGPILLDASINKIDSITISTSRLLTRFKIEDRGEAIKILFKNTKLKKKKIIKIILNSLPNTEIGNSYKKKLEETLNYHSKSH